MSYEEKYKEALKRADSLTEKYGGREFAEYVFPELNESDDERIRKKIIENVRLSGGYTDEEIDEMISWLEKQKEQKPAEWEDYKDKVNIPYCSSEPEWSEEDKMPMPEDTVIFQKGVAEGRRLEREDNNKALAEMYGYEGGTESELVKITFTIPKEHFKRLMPIKQGDVFGIENLTNKEVVG